MGLHELPRGQVVIGSDKLSSQQKPLLLLKMDLVDQAGEEKEVVLELDADELKSLVRNLGEAKKVSKDL
jgi:hypothetical protein